jgi:hypothetical protein
MTETGRVRSPARGRRARTRDEASLTASVEPETLAAPKRDEASEESERRLGRILAVATPGLTIVAALAVGELVAIGPAILVLAGGALFGTVAFLWASLRTLGGEAPLAEGFDRMSRRRVESPDSPAERKRAALRGLKDLEFEHSLGKIDDADYAELSARYREEAKAILKEIDAGVSPRRERAEEIVKSYLAKRGIKDKPPEVVEEVPPEPILSKKVPAEAPLPAPVEAKRGEARPVKDLPVKARVPCPSCEVSNEPDAVFCKKCGARLQPVECTACRTTNEPDAAFCKKCGKGLSKQAEETA